jgi:hypothetical protein
MAGSHNDINVLQRSPVISTLAEGHALAVDYVVNGHPYDKGYYLADSIYHPWSTFVKTICTRKDPKEARFAKEQESARKDVERVFGVLQSREIVRHPGMTWSIEVMTTCVIMHNMIWRMSATTVSTPKNGSSKVINWLRQSPCQPQHLRTSLLCHNQLVCASFNSDIAERILSFPLSSAVCPDYAS